MRNTSLTMRVFGLLFVLVLSSCYVPYSLTFDEDTFEYERKLWQEQGIQNYSFFFTFTDTMSSGPHLTRGTSTVRNGLPVDTESSNEYKVDGWWHSVPSWGRTIAAIFEKIEAEKKEKANGAVTIEVKYDSDYHFPVYFSYYVAGPSFPPPDPGDDRNYGYTVKISNFRVDESEDF